MDVWWYWWVLFIPSVGLLLIVLGLWWLRVRKKLGPDFLSRVKFHPPDICQIETREVLRTTYEGELTKMLSLILAWIATFTPALTIFIELSKNTTVTARHVMGSLSLLLLFVDGLLTLAILGKFQEIVMLERKLGVVHFYDRISAYRFWGARFWDWVIRGCVLKLGPVDAPYDYRKVNLAFNLVTCGIIGFLAFICGCVIAAVWFG